jgi:CRP-like cAMP-binding protein
VSALIRSVASAANERSDVSAPSWLNPLRDLEGLAEIRRYEPGEEICIEERNSEWWCRIIVGQAFRLTALANGQRLELDLLSAGDHFGFLVLDDRGFTIEAASEGVTVMRYPRWAVEFLAEVEPITASALRCLLRQAVYRIQSNLINYKDSHPRVGGHLPTLRAAAYGAKDRGSVVSRRFESQRA